MFSQQPTQPTANPMDKYNSLTLGGDYQGLAQPNTAPPTPIPPNPYSPAQMLQGMPSGIVMPEPQQPQAQQPSIAASFEPVLQGIFSLSQTYPQLTSDLQTIAGLLQSMAGKVAAENSQTGMSRSLV